MCLVHRSPPVDSPTMKRISLLFGILLLCLALPVLAAEKVIICHGSGLDDTTQFVTLEISDNAVYGPAGHFEESGTPQAGHEQDHFGPCADEPDVTTTTTGGVTTTTTGGVTTTTAGEVTTTTVGVTTTTAQGVTTTTTQGDTSITTTDAVVEEASVVAGLTVTLADQTAAATNQPAVQASVDAAAITELPFTGVDSGVLALIAVAFALAGTFVLKSGSIGVSSRSGI